MSGSAIALLLARSLDLNHLQSAPQGSVSLLRIISFSITINYMTDSNLALTLGDK